MLLEVREVTKSFTVRTGLFTKSRQEVLKGVSFVMGQGECVGIVGESGSGKSTLGRIILGLEKPDRGRVDFSKDKAGSSLARSVVFQDYSTSVNPRMRIAGVVAEPLIGLGLNALARKERVAELLEEVGLSQDLADHYPHQLSGGQLQRVCIARAIAPKPSFILCDEAVSSLDVSVQSQILDLLRGLKERYRISFLFITHDITVATFICDKLIFFKDGMVVEQFDDLAMLPRTENPYARQLLRAAHFLEKPFARRISHG
ncbi:ABC transporter ATP-binding protein [Desulfonatronum sp. SC1]|uniref:ABC transporter ATP-binding protein n=1 Tax=Desulfonatronum sp. SC1 TaxID=2109626 RepID=UPI000D318ABD|nr:dipeptide/oligopeptide/nickel ABC transporter ATP-binding protein [Desulfonatronum sp. SC1]PTN38629.1 peptide ABC transporter ATP-binding protein [Desulfonatronum sp. SC1]